MTGISSFNDLMEKGGYEYSRSEDQVSLAQNVDITVVSTKPKHLNS